MTEVSEDEIDNMTEEQEDELLAQMMAEEPEDEPEEEEPEKAATEEKEQDEAEPEAKAEEEKEDDKVEMVPHGALHEARQKGKAYKEQLDAAQATIQKMEEAFQKFQEAQKPKEPEINVEEDPVGYFQKGMTDLQQKVSGMEEQSQRAAEAQRFQAHVASLVDDFSKGHPDYDQAVNHVRQLQMAELQAYGYSQQEAAQELLQREWNFASMNVQRGRNPVEEMYNLAKQYGFNGAKPEKVSGEEKLEQIAKGQKATGLSGGSSSSSDDISLEKLSSLDGKDFDEAFQKILGVSQYS